MNAKTREELKEFILAMQNMALGIYTVLGENHVRIIVDKCEKLSSQLDKDETIV